MKKSLLIRITITLVLLLTVMLIPATPVKALDVNLKSAAIGTGTDVLDATVTWTDVVDDGDGAGAATANVNTSTEAGDKILVVASFDAEETKAMVGTFRIRDNDSTSFSSEFNRELTGPAKVNDSGIGSIVQIFTSEDGNDIFTLQHYTTVASMTTSATIVAIPLATSEGPLPYGEVYRTTTDTVEGSSAWEEVGDDASTPTTCRTGAVTLGKAAHIYVTASIESQQSGGGTQIGSWKLQYSTDNFSTAGIDLDVTMDRSFAGNNDKGLMGLVGLLQSQEPGSYYFRVMHMGTGTGVATNKVSLVAVGLEDGSHYLQAWKITPSSDTTSSTTLEGVTGGSVTFTPDVSSSDLFMHAQYQISADDVSTATYDILVDKLVDYDTQDEHRFIASGTDTGSGVSVGLTSTSNTLHTLALRHAINDNLKTLTTSNVALVGFAMGYDTETPPIPEWPTYLLVGSGMVLVVVYFWFRRNRAIATNSR
ncbi:hypothetical protein ACFLYV_00860 [Chloroflexota bacterium]